MEEQFYQWLLCNTNLGENSCRKYKRAVVTISKLAYEENITERQLYGCNLKELRNIKASLYDNNRFNIKNTTGNRMYSRALEYYEQFLEENGFN